MPIAVVAMFLAVPAHAQFGPEMKVHLSVQSPDSVPVDTAELATTVQFGIGQAGCAPYLMAQTPDPMRDEYLDIQVTVHADGTHRMAGAYRRGDQVVPAFENKGKAGYGPLLGALLAGAVREATAPRCSTDTGLSTRR